MRTRILTFTSLYPNSIQPNHGVFVEERMRNLCLYENIEYSVVAPVPWFPFLKHFSEKYNIYSRIPRHEIRNNVVVNHPRYLMIPKIGVVFQAISMAIFSFSIIRKMNIAKQNYDLLDAHYLYPDGVAAAILSKLTRLPLMQTARGTDVNVIAEIWYLKYQILWSTKVSSAVTTVSKALSVKLKIKGVESSKLRTIRNGVDMEKFNLHPPSNIKEKYSIKGPLLISVGNLIDGKGHDLVINAVREIKNTYLFIIGEGMLKSKLNELIDENELQERVFLLGRVEHDKMSEFYSSADILILMSKREGMPNVVLESLACGTPVITTDVGGIKEVVNKDELGVVLVKRTIAALVDAISSQISADVSSESIRKFAVENLSWKRSSKELKTLITGSVVGR